MEGFTKKKCFPFRGIEAEAASCIFCSGHLCAPSRGTTAFLIKFQSNNELNAFSIVCHLKWFELLSLPAENRNVTGVFFSSSRTCLSCDGHGTGGNRTPEGGV